MAPVPDHDASLSLDIRLTDGRIYNPATGRYDHVRLRSYVPEGQAADPDTPFVAPTIAVRPGETVGYSAAWTARRPSRIATVAAGYADGLSRRLGNVATVWFGDTPCPVVGRVSMDLITVDVTDLPDPPAALEILNARQGVDAVAACGGTIGYEVLTSLGRRYPRTYL